MLCGHDATFVSFQLFLKQLEVIFGYFKFMVVFPLIFNITSAIDNDLACDINLVVAETVTVESVMF